MPWYGWIAALIIVAALGFTGWLYTIGPWRAVDFTAEAPAPQPTLTAETLAAERPTLLEAFQREVYGTMPASIAPVVASKQEIAAADAGGIERVEQWRVEVGDAGHFNIAVARPPSDAPAPVILVLDFCGNQAAFPNRPPAIRGPVGYIQWFCQADAIDPIVERVFGRYVNGPPFADIAAHGYAVALVYPGDIVPDREPEARAALARFAPNDTGALMAWAWTASRAYEALASDPRFDANRIAVWGQSRQGKAALVAGVFDPRFAAVIALQSGVAAMRRHTRSQAKAVLKSPASIRTGLPRATPQRCRTSNNTSCSRCSHPAHYSSATATATAGPIPSARAQSAKARHQHSHCSAAKRQRTSSAPAVTAFMNAIGKRR